MPPIVLTPRELSDMIDATYEDILSWSRRGVIPSVRVGGRVYFNLASVMKALNRRQAGEQNPRELAVAR